MLKARKKLAALAVASAISGGALMVSAPVQALNVSQNNLGEVLLFPYYTVKNGFDTVFTVTNTTNKTAAFKIRFREALNSREVRDFNVVLSPYDHWAGAVTAKGDGATLRTFDNTCTSPDKPDWVGVDVNGDGTADGYEVDFTNALFTGIYKDGASEAMSRVQEGYFEVILMGVSTLSTSVSANVVEWGAKHKSNGVPNDCAAVDSAFTDVTSADWAGFTAPENILKGHVTYIDVATGKSVDAEPTAIENFQNIGQILGRPGDSDPDLSYGDNSGTVNVIADGVAISTPYTGSQHGVSMALMATSVINEFSSGSNALTNWVVTFPTKHHYVDRYTLASGTDTAAPTTFAPFSYRFVGDTDGTGMSCDKVSLAVFNREEKFEEKIDGTNFSPKPPVNNDVTLCYESNVITFNGGNIFGTGTNRLDVDTVTPGIGTSGWAQLKFISTNATQAGANTGPYVGLPVIGFSAIMRDSGSIGGNYGSNISHSFVSGARITP